MLEVVTIEEDAEDSMEATGAARATCSTSILVRQANMKDTTKTHSLRHLKLVRGRPKSISGRPIL